MGPTIRRRGDLPAHLRRAVCGPSDVGQRRPTLTGVDGSTAGQSQFWQSRTQADDGPFQVWAVGGLANSLVISENPDVETGCALTAEALNISRDRPITSVIQRSREFLAAVRPWKDSQAIQDVQDILMAAELR